MSCSQQGEEGSGLRCSQQGEEESGLRCLQQRKCPGRRVGVQVPAAVFNTRLYLNRSVRGGGLGVVDSKY